MSWRGANDQDRNKKRSNDVAYGAWVADKSKQEEVKKEFDNDLGVKHFLNFIFVFFKKMQVCMDMNPKVEITDFYPV